MTSQPVTIPASRLHALEHHSETLAAIANRIAYTLGDAMPETRYHTADQAVQLLDRLLKLHPAGGTTHELHTDEIALIPGPHGEPVHVIAAPASRTPYRHTYPANDYHRSRQFFLRPGDQALLAVFTPDGKNPSVSAEPAEPSAASGAGELCPERAGKWLRVETALGDGSYMYQCADCGHVVIPPDFGDGLTEHVRKAGPPAASSAGAIMAGAGGPNPDSEEAAR